MEHKLITFDSFIRSVIAVIIIVAISLLFNRLSGVLLPFFIAWLIAYMIYPIVHFFQYKLHLKNRILAIIVTIVVLASVVAGIFYLIIPPIFEEFSRLESLMVHYFTHGSLFQGTIPRLVNDYIQRNFDLNALQRILKNGTIIDLLKEGLPKLWQLLSNSISYVLSVVTLFLILLYVIFILKDYEVMSDGWISLLPNKYKGLITGIVSDVKQGMNQYFRGQAAVALCVGILFSIGFLIIDFPLAIVLGLLIGALNMVPYLHALGLIPVAILSILKSVDTGQNYFVVLASALAVFVVVQIIEDTIIVPKIMGKITGLNPAIILLSLSIWGSLMGIIGMIIALPFTTIMLSYYKRYILKQN